MKKRKRNKRKQANRKRPNSRNNKVLDAHHVCWYRKDWSHGACMGLRRHPYCIVYIPKNTLHRFIHTNMTSIPVPKEKSALYVIRQLDLLMESGDISQSDPIEKRLAILAALFEPVDSQTAKAFNRQLAIVHEFKKGP